MRLLTTNELIAGGSTASISISLDELRELIRHGRIEEKISPTTILTIYCQELIQVPTNKKEANTNEDGNEGLTGGPGTDPLVPRSDNPTGRGDSGFTVPDKLRDTDKKDAQVGDQQGHTYY